MKSLTDKEMSALFGAHLRKQRIKAGFSQDALGEAVGVTFQQIQKYENGVNRITFPCAVRIGAALGIDPRTLMDVVYRENGELRFIAIDLNPPTRRHLEAGNRLSKFTNDQLTAFKHFADALGVG